MSFLNKLWKNLRDHKSSTAAAGDALNPSSGSKKSASSSSNGKSHHHFPGSSSIEQGNYTDYPHHLHHHEGSNTRSHSSGHQSSHPSHHRKSSTLNFRMRKSDRNNDRNQNDYESSKSRKIHSKDDTSGLTDDSGFELDTSSEEFQLPPGILSDLSKHPTVSRHLSVSRSGRYKHRNKMRSNLFDVVKRDADDDADDQKQDDHEIQEKENDSSNNRVKSEISQKTCDATTAAGTSSTRHSNRRDSNHQRRSSSSGNAPQQQQQQLPDYADQLDPHQKDAPTLARIERRSRKGNHHLQGGTTASGTSIDAEIHAVAGYPVSGMHQGSSSNAAVSNYPTIQRNNRSHYDHFSHKPQQRTMPIPIATPQLPQQPPPVVTGQQQQQQQLVYQRHASHDHDHHNNMSGINRNGHHRDLRSSNSRLIEAIPVRHACS